MRDVRETEGELVKEPECVIVEEPEKKTVRELDLVFVVEIVAVFDVVNDCVFEILGVFVTVIEDEGDVEGENEADSFEEETVVDAVRVDEFERVVELTSSATT